MPFIERISTFGNRNHKIYFARYNNCNYFTASFTPVPRQI